jgi:hypothetical protein
MLVGCRRACCARRRTLPCPATQTATDFAATRARAQPAPHLLRQAVVELLHEPHGRLGGPLGRAVLAL